MVYTFEDKIGVINEQIAKRRGRWKLNAIAYMDFDDVAQLVRVHINEKWHMWDQSRPLENWLNRVITRRMFNIIRDNYGNVAPPCGDCKFNEGGDQCGYTKSAVRDSSCAQYAKWERGKKSAYHLKLAYSTDDEAYTEHAYSASRHDDELNFERAIKKLSSHMEKALSRYQYMIYKYLYIDGRSEAEVAELMGYKTSEENRSPGYKQLHNIKKTIFEIASKIIEKEDIFYES